MTSATRRKETLRDLFNTEAIRAVDTFKCLQGGLIIVDAAHAQASYAGKPSAFDTTTPDRREKEIDFITKITAGEKHSFCNIRWGYNLIVMAPHVTVKRGMFGLPQHQEVMFVLDHEIGHLVVPGGFMGGRAFTKEACADTYALLRAEQRWGDMTPFLRANRFKRAFDATFKGRMTHFTLPATAALDAMRANLDIKNMSPADITALANTVMKDNTPDGVALAEIQLALMPVKAAYADSDANLPAAIKVLKGIIAEGKLSPLGMETVELTLNELARGDLLVHGKAISKTAQRAAADTPPKQSLIKRIIG